MASGDADVGGAQQAGPRGVLVRSGKFSESQFAASAVVPDTLIDGVSELPRFLA